LSPLPRSQLLKGTTDLLVLAVLEHDRLHGYEILQRIRGNGAALSLSEGALYPTLHRLERDGAISGRWETSDSGPRRRSYGLTDAGRGRLAQSRAAWEEFVRDVGAVAGRTEDGIDAVG
jgi:PadR family transcriptional regulator, regulatory protein PadR